MIGYDIQSDILRFPRRATIARQSQIQRHSVAKIRCKINAILPVETSFAVLYREAV
jgi:hypothetical protein